MATPFSVVNKLSLNLTADEKFSFSSRYDFEPESYKFIGSCYTSYCQVIVFYEFTF